MLKNLWTKLTGKKEEARNQPAPTQEQTVDQTLSDFKGSKKDLLKLMRNPTARKKILEIMQRMSKDGVNTDKPEEIKKWLESHKEELNSNQEAPPKPSTVVRENPKVGRNDPCVCGSGKKFKKCCANKKK